MKLTSMSAALTTILLMATVNHDVSAQNLFNVTSSYLVAQSGLDMQAGDMNNDRIDDLVVTDRFGRTVVVLLGQADGTFTRLSPVQVSGQPTGLTLADFDGDRDIDVAVTLETPTNKIQMLFGSSTGLLTAQTAFTGPPSINSIVSGDFNEDGTVDLAVGNSTTSNSKVHFYRGQRSASTFTFVEVGSYAIGDRMGTRSLIARDFDRDGNIDVAASNSNGPGVRILYGNGSLGFTSSTLYSQPNLVALTSGDLNQDGYPDLAIPSNNDKQLCTILSGSGGPRSMVKSCLTVSSSQFPAGAVIQDFNGDGKQDIAVADYGIGQVIVYSGNGSGGLTELAPRYAVTGASTLVAGDVDRDGIMDLLVGAGTGRVTILRGTRGQPIPASNLTVLAEDSFNQQAIHGAEVRVVNALNQTAAQCTTDAEGRCVFSVPPGIYSVYALHNGYFLYSNPLVRVSNSHLTLTMNMSSRTVVLVHGVTSDGGMWDEELVNPVSSPATTFRQHLEQNGYRVVSPSLVPSDKEWCGYYGGIQSQSYRLSRVVDSLSAVGTKSVHMVAHSMGGLVSRYYLSEHPNTVDKLITLGTPHFGSDVAGSKHGVKLLLFGLFRDIRVRCPDDFPPAALDLTPSSRMLGTINYDDPTRQADDCTGTRDPISTLRAETQHWAFYTNHLGRLCNGGLNLTTLIMKDPCGRDGVVYANSAKLSSNNPLVRFENLSDVQCGTQSQHIELEPLVCNTRFGYAQDRVIAEKIVGLLRSSGTSVSRTEALETTPEATPVISNADAVFGQSQVDEQQITHYEWSAVGPLNSWVDSVRVSSADSVCFAADAGPSVVSFSLVDPQGGEITPTSHPMDVDVSYSVDGTLMRYTVRAATTGLWRLVAMCTGPDTCTVEEVVWEYGGCVAQAEWSTPVGPEGTAETCRVTVDDEGGRVTGLTCRVSMSMEGAPHGTLVLNDAGLDGDLTPNDGEYAGSLFGLSRGLWSGRVIVEGSTPTSRSISRTIGSGFSLTQRSDLAVTGQGIAVSSYTPHVGDLVRVSTTTTNTGLDVVDSALVEIFVEKTGEALLSMTELNWGPNAQRAMSLDVEVSHEMDDSRIGVRVIPLTSASDVDLSNNLAYSLNALNVGLPDLCVASGGVVVNPERPRAGDMVFVDVSVKNNGSVTAENVAVSLIIGRSVDTGSQWGNERTLTSLNAGASGNVQWELPYSQGDTLWAVVDRPDHIAEKNEDNNSLGVLLQADLPVAIVVSNMVAEAQGDEVVIRWQVSGSEDALVGFNLYRLEGADRTLVNGAVIVPCEKCEVHDVLVNASPDRVQYLVEAVGRSGMSDWYGPIDVVSVDPGNGLFVEVPQNPLGLNGSILVAVDRARFVSVRLFDLQGRLVRSIFEGSLSAGDHRLQVDAGDTVGEPLNSGIYFVSVDGGAVRIVKKIVVVR